MNFFDCVLDFLFPPVCGICLKRNGKSICDECRKIINYKSINKNKKYKKKYFYKHLYIFKYEGIIRQRLLEYKFKEKAYLYKTFAETIIHDKDNIEYIKKYDILIPVPIHKKRKKDRGYNQSELIAKEIVKFCKDIKLELNILYKKENIVAQSTLDKKERMKNIKNVFEIRNECKIKNKKILLLDDIYTTGSTVNECSRILKNAGCKEIGIITIAKD